MESREFHFSEGTSNKFWKITVDGKTQTVHYGRLGTAGQEATKVFDSDAAAKSASDKLIAEKVKKGYAEVDAGATASPSPTPKPPVQPKPMSTAVQPVVAEVKTVDASVDKVAVPSDDTALRAAVAPAAAPDEDLLTIVRSLDLSDDDYVRAGVRPRKPKAKPAAPPFNFQECVDRFRPLVSDYRGWKFEKARISPVITKEEAHFWITVLFRSSGYGDKNALISELGSMQLNGQVDDRELYLQGKTHWWWQPEEMAIFVAALRPLTTFVEIQARADESREFRPVAKAVFRGFEKYVLPYLTADEIASLQKACRDSIAKSGTYTISLLAFAAKLGLADIVSAEVSKWADVSQSNMYGLAESYEFETILGICDRSSIITHARRTKSYPVTSDQVRMWLAATEYDAIGFVADAVLEMTERNETEVMTRALARAHAPEAALPMLRLYHESKAVRVAREWFDANPNHAAAGLTPVAASNDPYAKKAVDALADLARRGFRNIVAAHIGTLASDVAERLRGLIIPDDAEPAYEPLDESTTPVDLRNASPANVKPRPGDPAAGELPAIVVCTADGSRRLNDQQIANLVSVLRASTLESPGEYIAAVKRNADVKSLDAFAWALFERWLSDGASPKEKWQLLSVGLLGGDMCALKLAALVRKWPGEAQHARAVTGLECLRAMGTDTALMQINGIANKVPFKAIKQRAADCMDDIAKARGMTRAQLEDRIVPDCDLDDRGSREFDFGPRQFKFVLSPEMKAMVKDGVGKIASDLPKPNSKDDPEKSEAAVAEWKLLKKQVSEVGKIQAARLEQAMVTGRRWTAGEFDQLLVRHPLMTNLVRLLLWGVYDADGKLASTFRVTEDQSLADNADEVFTLPTDGSVGVVHPLQLSTDERSTWGEIWSDYEIVPPFPQLGRAVHTLADDERDLVDMKRFGQSKLPCATVVFTLDKLGWSRAQPADAGGFCEHTKPFYGANVTAVAQYDPGCSVGWIVEADPQRITDVFFVPGIVLPGEWWPKHANRLTWGDVDPVVVSEVLADLTSIIAKAG